jgi:UDP-glucose 4-epimerase
MAETLLITGGAGFIGSHLAEEALAAGHRVVVLDNLATGKRSNVPPGAVFLERDLRQRGIEDVLRDHQVTVVSHHAAQANVRVSTEDPVFDAEVNVIGGLNLIAACVRAGVRRLVFASSGGTVYGAQQAFPCDEKHPTQPESPYGCAKLAIEHYLMAYARNGDLEPVILRYANIYGPRQDPKGEAGIVAILARNFLAGTRPKIFGDGTQTRDYVYVGDLRRIQTLLLEGWVSGAFNVGTGVETGLNDLYARIERRLAVRIEPQRCPRRAGELWRNSLDATALREKLPGLEWTPLERGLEQTLPSYVEQARSREPDPAAL